MSHRDGDYFIATHTRHGPCELCGVVAELRPYGPNGENICEPCGRKNPEATERAIRRAMKGAKAVLVIEDSP